MSRFDPDSLYEIWLSVERLCRLWARKYLGNRQTPLFDFDDLMQQSFLAVCDAARSFDSSRGSFNTLLKYHVRTRFSEVAGKRSSKYQHTISLDEPLTDDTDMTRLDMIVDESATDAFDDVTENVYISQLHETLEQCLSTLPEVQADTLRARYYDKRTVSAIASMKDVDMAVVRRHEIRALGALRLGKSAALLAEYRDDIVSKSIRFCTFASFDHTGYSSTEWATERLLDYEKRLF